MQVARAYSGWGWPDSWLSDIRHTLAYKVKEASVIAVPHKRRTERPLAVLVLHNDDEPVSEQEFRELLLKDFPAYHLSDQYVFAKEISKTNVGRFDCYLIKKL